MFICVTGVLILSAIHFVVRSNDNVNTVHCSSTSFGCLSIACIAAGLELIQGTSLHMIFCDQLCNRSSPNTAL